ncbi:L-aspartate oxidase [Calidithermus roseus]|uniref:L-aspartate oxidase n=1 Tax=Calidithermus roseus TaxID=1644118 RepID=A0A399EXX7_9DEIN|nr:L-aspartate oxidase [Calidithermus roseus]RIH87899.1 L-aspartate oxidase [Calidithermus roseus]
MELIQTEVLIIGSGIGGGITALSLADAGIPVTVVTRSSDGEESNTAWAQGGIIYKGPGDSPELLIEDILRAGAGHSHLEAARILAEEGPAKVEEWLLERLQVPFDQSPSGELSLALEGGHSLPRILHAADATGLAIHRALMAALEAHPSITLLKGHTAIDLLTPAHHSLNRLDVYGPLSCVGAYLFDRKERAIKRCIARHTVLATGGLGQVFLSSTNPPGARGDGVAMAYRAGARVINMEFVQFHPTTFHLTGAPPFLISEAVRGEGARLVDASGQPFMQHYDPQWKDLAPRDVVSRSIYHYMLEHDLPHVYLDLRSYIPKEKILSHFPNIHAECLRYGIDITQDLVPVVPGAHYSCGGVWVDGWGQTTLQGLYAVGEVACTGLHGANRLASTSLLEGLVWGDRIARHIRGHLEERPLFDPERIPPWQNSGHSDPDPALVQQDMSVIKHIMWNYVGLVRTTPRLERALRELRHLETEIEGFYRNNRLSDGVIGLRNAVRTAILIAMAAWENKRSMGCHYRE